MTATEPKIRLRRSHERGYEDFGWTDNWMTFSFGGYHDPQWNNFGPLRVIVENHIQPRSGFPSHSHRDVEIVTYVSAGTLTHKDSFGHEAGVTAGEMQLISAGSRGMIHSEMNVHDEVEHNIQIWLIPSRHPTEFAYHQLKYSPEDRQGHFRLYVSPDGRDGSMPINTDAFIYSGLFHGGGHCHHQLQSGRGAWLQIVKGKGILLTGTPKTGRTFTFSTGDGVGITDESLLNFSFEEPTEAILFDVNMSARLLWR